MVTRAQRFCRLVQAQLLEAQGRVAVNVVEVQERQKTTLSPGPAQVHPDVRALEMRT